MPNPPPYARNSPRRQRRRKRKPCRWRQMTSGSAFGTFGRKSAGLRNTGNSSTTWLNPWHRMRALACSIVMGRKTSVFSTMWASYFCTVTEEQSLAPRECFGRFPRIRSGNGSPTGTTRVCSRQANGKPAACFRPPIATGTGTNPPAPAAGAVRAKPVSFLEKNRNIALPKAWVAKLVDALL